MLRKIRTILALVFFLGITALFLDFSGVLYHWFGWMAKIQFLPAVLASSFVIVAVLLLLTLLFGRVYCSVICPLGVMQDGFNFVARKVKKNRFHYIRERAWLRYFFLALFVVLMIIGLNSVAILIAPYSAYGRIASNLLQPLYFWINNLFASIAEHNDSYSFYHVDVWVKSSVSLVVAIATLVLVASLSIRRGRTWCNTVCPVGTVLGLFSRFSLFRPVIDESKCKNCHKCEHGCKSSCIDIENHRIDYSRCVACMDCLSECGFDAIHFSGTRFRLNPSAVVVASHGNSSSESVDESRRNFIVSSAMVAGAATLKAQGKRVDGGLAVVEQKQIPVREVPLKPAGSVSLDNFSKHCTACQLCVAECPNHVLHPSEDLRTLMQPEMSFERGYCRPECTRCSHVCPTGAIRPVTPGQKSDTHIGYAVIVNDNCVAWRDGVMCGNCARHCPSEAILMVPKDGDSESALLVPTVLPDRCIGCGACEYLCPARPFSAIFVNGYSRHR
ncbi:MAG: 4Fe-4S binding protein [Bacteroidales bacterium]|nr:4Fe-4S binding protein [Bacteroidales bacterium]